MKTAGAIYKKLREVKFHHLIDLYRKYLKKIPENCKYNYSYALQGRDGKEHIVGLCLFHQEDVVVKTDPPRLSGIMPHLMDVCEANEDCRHCDAFIQRYDRQSIKELFENELAIKSIRETKYPDICALEWVLERSSVGILPAWNLWALLKRKFKNSKNPKQE
jgi:hypothetical protein